MIPIVKLIDFHLVAIEIPLGDGSTFCYCLDKGELAAFMRELMDAFEEMED
jgi:hypothetical protein